MCHPMSVVQAEGGSVFGGSGSNALGLGETLKVVQLNQIPNKKFIPSFGGMTCKDLRHNEILKLHRSLHQLCSQDLNSSLPNVESRLVREIW